MREFASLADLTGAAGEHLGYSSWHEVTQEQVNQFADATGDHQWIHVDVDRAKAGPFGTTIAHGYLVLSLLPMLASEVYRVGGVQIVSKVTVELDGAEKPCCVAEAVSRFLG